jgi:hypothetical protein
VPILALSQLVQQGLEKLPESVQQMGPHLLPIFLTLFEGLPWAYSCKAEEDGDDDDDDDDDDEENISEADAVARGIDVEELENLEDEEDYDETEVQRIVSELAVDFDDMGSGEYDDGQFGSFPTLIDTKEKDAAFDEYGAFMRVLEGMCVGQGKVHGKTRLRLLSFHHFPPHLLHVHFTLTPDLSQRGLLAPAMSNLTSEQAEILEVVKAEAQKRAVRCAPTHLLTSPSLCRLSPPPSDASWLPFVT